MGACVGKYKRPNDECESQPFKFRFSTALTRDARNKARSKTQLYDLPLEMLDVILQKSYLHWVLNSTTKQRDEEVIRSLLSVDLCFNRRITKQWFKKTVWRYLEDFYGKTEKTSAIIRINRNYILQHIQPTHEFIASLLSLNCITEEQSHFIQRQRTSQDMNEELLYATRFFDKTKFSNFVKCLRETNQQRVARIIESGGGVIKMKLQSRGSGCATSMETEEGNLHKKIINLIISTTSWSQKTDRLISQMRDEGLEILSSQLDRRTVVVWIWCHTQGSLEHIQKLYESNQLRNVFFENSQSSSSNVINIDRNQFKKTIVVCPISVSFNKRIEIRRKEKVRGMTKLRHEIFVLCRSQSSPLVIRVFEDRNAFRFQRTIKINEIESVWDVESNQKENCLYVSDYKAKCVWKITEETHNKHTLIKWLTTDYTPSTISVSGGDQLLVVSCSSSILSIYGSDAEEISLIQLSRDIKPRHAVKTSIGHFVVLYTWVEEMEGENGFSEENRIVKLVISELTGDGQMVIRRFIPSNGTQELNDPRYLSIDSDDRVFVVDAFSGRVILLDSNLRWNRILCPTKTDEEIRMQMPWRLCYDEEMKQLIAGELFGGVYIYTLCQH